MTDFRLVWSLRAYSGGTVPASDRISYSPLSLNESQRHSDAYEITVLRYTVLPHLSIGNPKQVLLWRHRALLDFSLKLFMYFLPN